MRRALVVGVSGTGKSTLARRLVSRCRRLIVVDPLAEWADEDPSIVAVESWPDAVAELQRPAFRLSLEVEDDPDDLVETAARLARAAGDAVLVVDELSWFWSHSQVGPEIGGAVRFGRRQGLSLVLISQRSYDCPILLRSQLTDVYAFRSTEPRDVDYLGAIVGRDEAKQVRDLRGHQFIHWNLAADPEGKEET